MLRAAAIFALLAAGAAPAPPDQPPSGPGGADYAHEAVARRAYGTGAGQYWLFEPAEPTPASAPVVVFVHGWMGIPPAIYMGWIRHIVRRGRIVVYPRYQEGALTRPWTFTPNALGAVKQALAKLEEPGHVRPERGHFALVGHSAGGAIAADLAALAAEEGLPKPRALMVVQPGRGVGRARTPFFPAADYTKIPGDTLLLVVVGEDDRLVGERAAKDLFRQVSHIPPERKDYVLVRSDDHGEPPLVADHLSPCSPLRPHPVFPGRRIDALDYYAYWKLFDALTDYAFAGTHGEVALGDTPRQRYMGRWSDGAPVAELRVTDAP
ncbi:MAG: chlorophyllase/cutinase-like alpha/beta fold protein [Candidatus Brocadiia bacterium]